MEARMGRLIGKHGVQLVYGQWYPEGEPVGIALVVHGYGEHIRRYLHVIEALRGRGFAIFAVDHRGHGESEGERAWVAHFDDFVEDLDLLVKEATGAHPDLPTVMIGHSMGGLIAMRYVLSHPEPIDLLVLSGAAIRVGDDTSPLLKALSGLIARVAPRLPVVGTVPNVLSRDPEVEKRFQEDPLCYNGKLKAGMGYQLLSASQEVQGRLAQLTLPLLIMHGTEDRLTSPAGSSLLYERASSTDKTLKFWEGAYHEIFNELNKEEVIDFMLSWLDERIELKVP